MFDAVYVPMVTKLLQEAKECGCKTVGGVEMFIGQAAQQFELFTGQEAPVELMRTIVTENLASVSATSKLVSSKNLP